VTSKKKSISSHAFKVRYLRRSREIYRNYLATKPWIKEMHASFLGLKPGMRIVDVGCGTGDFTRYIASLVPGKSTIIGVDARSASLRSAEKETAREKFTSKISYRKGDVYKIPVDDDWADLVCCRTLIMHLTKPVEAVKEMARVTRKGGTVAAFERGTIGALFIPGEEKLTRLALRLGKAYVDGVRRLEGKYFDVGERLPTIFREAGLRQMMAEIQADTYLTTDPRRKLQDVKDELSFELANFKETKKVSDKAMLAGGGSRGSIAKYNRWFEKYVKGLLKNEQKLLSDTTLGAGAIYLVAGRKK